MVLVHFEVRLWAGTCLRGVLYWLLSLTQHYLLPVSKDAEVRRNLITLRSLEAWQNVFILAPAQTVDYCRWSVFKVKRSRVHLQVWGKPGALCGICKCLDLRWANIHPSRCVLWSVRNEMATDKCRSPFIWMKQSTVFLTEVILFRCTTKWSSYIYIYDMHILCI